MGQFEDALTTALNSAPELQQMPGVAVALGQSQDPERDAQALAHVAHIAAATTAYQQVKKRHGWLDDAIGDIGGAVATVGKPLGMALDLAAKPLQEVQHQYRYLRDVYRQKGVAAGLAETLGVAAGATAGALLTGSAQGGVLGAELVAGLEGRLTYGDVWESSKDSGGSLGRDLTSAVGLGKNRWISGVLDGVADLAFDPLANAGGISAATRGAEGLGGALGKLYKGTSLNSLEAVDTARRTLPSYGRALRDIAKMSEVDIAKSYPKLRGVAHLLGEATTDDEVHQVFRNVAKGDELLRTGGQLPTMTLTRQALVRTGRALQDNAPGMVDKFLLRPFEMEPAAWDDLKETFSNKHFDAMSPDAPHVIYQLTRIGETVPTARMVAEGFAAEPSLDRRLEIYNNAIMDVILARAKVDPNLADPNYLRHLRATLTDLTTYGEGKYVGNMDGEDISRVATDGEGTERAAGVRINQVGKTFIPNFIALKRAGQTLRGYNEIFGAQIAKGAGEDAARLAAEKGAGVGPLSAADDWVYAHVTGSVFKPLVTLSGGFATRISASEVIPQTLRLGFYKTIQSTLAGKYAALGQKVAEDDVSRMGAAVYAALGGDHGLIANTDAVRAAVKQIEANGGDLLHPAIDAGHNGGISDVAAVEKHNIDLRKQVQTSPRVREKAGDDFDWFDKNDPLRIPRWQANLREAAGDPATQAAAGAARSVLDAGGDIEAARNAGAMGAAKFIREHPDMYDPKFIRHNNLNVGMDWADHWGRITSEGMFGDVGYKLADPPAVAPGMVRLYRGEAIPGTAGVQPEWLKGQPEVKAMKEASGRWFTTSHDDAAKFYAADAPNGGRVRYIDIPSDDAAKYLASNDPVASQFVAQGRRALGDEHFLPRELANAAKPMQSGYGVNRDLLDAIADAGVGAGLQRGAIVRAADRDNFGRIVSTDDTHATVHFHNKAEGTHARVRLPHDTLTPVSGASVSHDLEEGRLSLDNLAAIPTEQQPLKVKGRMTVTPDTGGTIQRIANFGHRKFLEPIINTLAREPVFNTEFRKQYESLVASGMFSDDAAVMLANTRAAHNVLPYIHNTAERSQLGYTVRNFMPFYFAQEQAWKRAGRLLAEDPGAFRKYQLMMTGLVESGFGSSDGEGNGHLVMPGSGFLTGSTVKALSAIGVPIAGSVPTGLDGNLKSLSTVFPFVEDPVPWHKPGPMVSIPLKAIENLRPEIGPITDAVIGDHATAGSLWDQIIPNQFVKNAISAMGARGDTVAQHNSTLAIIQQLADRGELPDQSDVMGMQKFIDRAKTQSRVLDGVKALVSLISPVSPSVKVGGHLADITNEYIKKYGDVALAMQHLTADHPDLTPQTVFKSTTTLGEAIPAYAEAQEWIDTHKDLIAEFPQAAAFLVPQHKGDKFSQSVYNEQLAMHLRQRKTPEQFLKDIYVAAGNSLFYGRDLPVHQAAVQAATDAGDTQGASQERASFQNYIETNFGPQNPVWWSHYKAPDNQQNKQRAISGLVEIFAKGRAPDTEQSRDVAALLADWSTHMAAMKPGVGVNLAAADRTAENSSWDAYLHSLALEKPQLVPVINALFRDLGQRPLTSAAV